MTTTPQTGLMVQALKRALRARGITYARVAEELGLSEPSVKRLFANAGFSLQRLEQVSHLAGLSLTELARQVEDRGDEIRQLTEEQEETLVAEPKLLLVFYLVLNRYALDNIIAEYEIDELEGVRLLARLDRMGLIELQPGNRVRLLTSPSLSWREDGPIRRFFDQRVREEFFDSRFDQSPETLRFLSGMLSRASQRVMQRKLALLANEFNELVRLDSTLPLEERFGCSIMLAQRVWAFSAFSRFARKD